VTAMNAYLAAKGVFLLVLGVLFLLAPALHAKGAGYAESYARLDSGGLAMVRVFQRELWLLVLQQSVLVAAALWHGDVRVQLAITAAMFGQDCFGLVFDLRAVPRPGPMQFGLRLAWMAVAIAVMIVAVR
jgi:hypothetical protein